MSTQVCALPAATAATPPSPSLAGGAGNADKPSATAANDGGSADENDNAQNRREASHAGKDTEKPSPRSRPRPPCGRGMRPAAHSRPALRSFRCAVPGRKTRHRNGQRPISPARSWVAKSRCHVATPRSYADPPRGACATRRSQILRESGSNRTGDARLARAGGTWQGSPCRRATPLRSASSRGGVREKARRMRPGSARDRKAPCRKMRRYP
jgi:hypothetical protein